MGILQSKGKLLYQQVHKGNEEKIRALRNKGASLEWRDEEGKTPLIVACMNVELYHIAEILIQLGANVNASAPAPFDTPQVAAEGTPVQVAAEVTPLQVAAEVTPLQVAAEGGLGNTVSLLLRNGANVDSCWKLLKDAKEKKFHNVVRAIESHICYFSDWMVQTSPNCFSKKVWVVIVPVDRKNKPDTLSLAVYNHMEDAQPHTELDLWIPDYKEERNWRSRESATFGVRDSTLKLIPRTDGGSQQLERFRAACAGNRQRLPSQAEVDLRAEPSARPVPSARSSTALARRRP